MTITQFLIENDYIVKVKPCETSCKVSYPPLLKVPSEIEYIIEEDGRLWDSCYSRTIDIPDYAIDIYIVLSTVEHCHSIEYSPNYILFMDKNFYPTDKFVGICNENYTDKMKLREIISNGFNDNSEKKSLNMGVHQGYRALSYFWRK